MVSKSHKRILGIINFPKRHPSFNVSGKHGNGFTLLELVIIVAIIATLAGIAIPVYTNQIGKARIFKAISDIKVIEKDIEAYRTDNNSLPTSLESIGLGDLLDPWGNPYQYANHNLILPGKRRKYHGEVPLNMDFDLFSMGADGQFGIPLTDKKSKDDIVRADDGGYIGLASEY